MSTTALAFGQVPPSDGPQFQTQAQTKSVSKTSNSFSNSKSSVVCNALSITATETIVCDTGSAVLNVTGGQCDYRWYSDPLFTNKIGWNDSLLTDTIHNDSTFYVRSRCPIGGVDSTVALPPHGSVYSGNVRGYYFVAPCDFIITGLWVPTDASAGTQNVEVVLFDADTVPGLWPSTTNAFKSLGYWNNYAAADTIPVCMYVDSGEVVGIYGNRTDQNSYQAAPYNGSINGIPTTLYRSGMQQPLSSNQMADIFAESAGSISRTEFFYTVDMDTNDAQYTVVVPQSYDLNATPSICSGDSIFLGGAFQTAPGSFLDTLQSVHGCDSIVASVLTVNSLPTVMMAPFSPDTVCTTDPSFALPPGTPASGSYTGTGVAGNNFDPTVAGQGSYFVTYTYTDINSCASSDSAEIHVIICAGINNNNSLNNAITVYPNPVEDYLTINLSENNNEQINMKLIDAVGKTVMEVSVPENSQKATLNCSSLSKGIYFLIIPSNEGGLTYKITKK